MGAQAHQLQLRQSGQPLQGAGQLARGHAQTAHAGVDLHVDVHAAPRLLGSRREPLEIALFIDDRGESLGDHLVLVTVVISTQHQDGGANAGRAKLEPLFDQRHRQRVAQRLESARHRDGAMTVCVGLDDAEDPDAGADQVAEASQVPLNSAQVHLGHGGTDRGADVDLGVRHAGPLRGRIDRFGLARQTLQSFTRARRTVNSVASRRWTGRSAGGVSGGRLDQSLADQQRPAAGREQALAHQLGDRPGDRLAAGADLVGQLLLGGSIAN